MFDGDDLKAFIDQATYVTVNDYEWELLTDRTGLDAKQITQQVEALIITLGAKGAVIHTRDGEIEIPCAPVSEAVDPTGCGDAFRAGLLHGVTEGMDWATTGRVASLLGAAAVEHAGTQNHFFTVDEFKARFEKSFGYAY